MKKNRYAVVVAVFDIKHPQYKTFFSGPSSNEELSTVGSFKDREEAIKLMDKVRESADNVTK